MGFATDAEIREAQRDESECLCRCQPPSSSAPSSRCGCSGGECTDPDGPLCVRFAAARGNTSETVPGAVSPEDRIAALEFQVAHLLRELWVLKHGEE